MPLTPVTVSQLANFDAVFVNTHRNLSFSAQEQTLLRQFLDQGGTLYLEDSHGSRIEVDSAASYDALERWAGRLDEEAEQDDSDYVDSDLRYASSSLSRYGSWITISSRRYWRPAVSAGWRE